MPVRVTAMTLAPVCNCELMAGSVADPCQVVVDEFPAVGKGGGPGRFPAGGFEQADGGGVDVVLPGREQPDVAPLLDSGASGGASFEDQRFESAFDQVGRGGQAHGACALLLQWEGSSLNPCFSPFSSVPVTWRRA